METNNCAKNNCVPEIIFVKAILTLLSDNEQLTVARDDVLTHFVFQPTGPMHLVTRRGWTSNNLAGGWLAGSMGGWEAGRLGGWVAWRLGGWVAGWLGGWVAKWLSGWEVGWLGGWVAG